MSKSIPELRRVEFEEGEVGEPVDIETPAGTVRATWLGIVSNGKELAKAMALMWELAEEKTRNRDNEQTTVGNNVRRG